MGHAIIGECLPLRIGDFREWDAPAIKRTSDARDRPAAPL
jgi:hypothetical protein